MMRCLFAAVLCMAEVLLTASEVPPRDAAITSDRLRLERDFLVAGGYAAMVRSLAPWREGVVARLAEAARLPRKPYVGNDIPVPGLDGILFSGRRMAQMLFETALDDADDVGVRRYAAFAETALACHRELAAHGIDLMVVPVPDKNDIHPEAFGPWPAGAVTAMPRTKALLLRLLRSGVEVLDLEPALRAARTAGEVPPYMRQDTHWSPAGIAVAAGIIADRCRRYDFFQQVQTLAPRFVEDAERDLRRDHDLAGNWRLAGKPSLAPEVYRLRGWRAVDPADRLVVDDAPVLVLGDSYAVYPYDDALNFPGQLAGRLNLPVAVEDNAGGGNCILRYFARLPAERKVRVRVIVWLFTSCSIYETDYASFPLFPEAPAVAPVDAMTATVVLITAPPAVDPATLSYPDALVTLEARVEGDDGTVLPERVLLSLPFITGRTALAAASLVAGQRLRVELRRDFPPASATRMSFETSDDITLPFWWVASFASVE